MTQSRPARSPRAASCFSIRGTSLTVNGDVTINYAGGLILTGYLGGGNNTLNVSGTVASNNSGGSFYVLGQGDVADVGQIVNHYDVQIGTGATLNLTNEAGLTDIAYDADYIVQGTFTAEGNSALASLTTLEGALVLENGQNTNITPLGGTFTLNGASGGFGGSLLLDEGTSLHVNGNFNALYGGISVRFPKGERQRQLVHHRESHTAARRCNAHPGPKRPGVGRDRFLTVMYGGALGGVIGVGHRRNTSRERRPH